ncbi:MAG TPA: hypothetical protein VNO70_24045, partial [Blastocatellia bacterium]|nr:hypothetical protein [Blastocatellia bacterium]
AGRVYVIDPTQPAGAVTLLEDNTGPNPYGITFDGVNLWTANASSSVTRIPLTGGAETTFTAEFNQPYDILWDGENLWVADFGTEMVKRIDPASGVVLESIPVGTGPIGLLFDGVNLWVSVFFDDSVAVVRAAGDLRGRVLATLTGNGLVRPRGLAFDGERILTVNFGGPSASLFKAADFTPLGSLSVGAMAGSQYVCSDGLNFWITRTNTNDIVRF